LPSLNENQFSALVSFVFNCGVGALKGSTALKRIKAGDMEGGAQALTWWNKATVNGRKKVLPGLVRRREAEKQLFLDKVFNSNPNQDIINKLRDCIKLLGG
jgi:lysozyme